MDWVHSTIDFFPIFVHVTYFDVGNIIRAFYTLLHFLVCGLNIVLCIKFLIKIEIECTEVLEMLSRKAALLRNYGSHSVH